MRIPRGFPVIGAVLFGLIGFAVAENFPIKFQAAVKLESKPLEAMEALLKLAKEEPPSRYAKLRRNACNFQAARFAGVAKRYDVGMELAESIRPGNPLRTLAKMELLARQRRYEAIMELAGDAKIDIWPDPLVYEAAMLRATAAEAQGVLQMAEEDYILAERYTLDPNRKGKAMLALADLYREKIEDTSKALAAYAKVMETSPDNWRLWRATLAHARLIAESGRGEAALTELARSYKESAGIRKNAHFRALYQELRGDIHLAMGNRDEALAEYRAILEAPAVPPHIVKSAKDKITKLSK